MSYVFVNTNASIVPLLYLSQPWRYGHLALGNSPSWGPSYALWDVQQSLWSPPTKQMPLSLAMTTTVCPDIAKCSPGAGCKVAPDWEPVLYMRERKGDLMLTSHLPVSVWEIWQSRELCRRSPVLHRMWHRDGARPSGSKVPVYHVLRDGGAPQVNGPSAAIFLSSSQN